MAAHRRYAGGFRWEGVPLQPYKEEGTHFRGVSRQLLFGGAEGAVSELRYFEVDPGGHTSLERHEHAHEVMILRGRGRALAGDRVVEVRPYDLVQVPPRAWHQFRAADDEALGFLCLVDRERDRPQRPSADELAELRARPELAAFLRV